MFDFFIDVIIVFDCFLPAKGFGLVESLYQSPEVSERHRHRYEVNPIYHSVITEKGMVFSGCSRDGRLVEFIELPSLKFFLATQAHPELKSRMEAPAPLFYGFVKACLDEQ